MKKSIVVSIGIAATLLMGCRQEAPSQVHSGQLLQVDALIEGVTQGGSVGQSSRAVVSDAAWKAGSTFGLWVVPYKVTGSGGTADEAGTLRTVNNYADNIKHTFAGPSVNPAAETLVYYPTSEGKVDLYAVSPHATYPSNTLPSTTAYPHSILADQTPANGSAVVVSDLMTGKGTGTALAGASITFTHRMSKALIGFKVPATYKTKAVLAVQKVELVGVPLHTTINLTDASIAPVPTDDLTPKDISAYQAEKPTSGTAGDYIYEAIVVPGSTIASGASLVRITLQVDGLGDVPFNCKLTGTDHTFVAQQQTDINITIEDQTEIVLDATRVTITPWGATANISGSTSKLSKMIFEYEDPTGLWPLATTCDAATLVIEGETIQATKVQYVAGTPSQFVIEYDHGLSSMGGYLEFITIKTTVGGITLFNNVGLKGINGGKPRGYQIKGDPTLSSYSEKIGKITVTAANIASIAPIL